MQQRLRTHFSGYFVAVAATAVVAAARFAFADLLGEVAPFLPFVLAVTVAAWHGGLKPGLVATALSASLALYLFTPPRYTFRIQSGGEFAGVALTVVIGVTISWLCEFLHSARRRVETQRESLRVTLASIGDAVIAVDLASRVVSMNPVAATLTGWSQAEASGRPLEQVFRIINEATRKTVDNPVRKALAENRIVGLANHTMLIARDGTERPIDDSAAPIRDSEGRVTGVVLSFHDISERRLAEKRRQENEERFQSLVLATSQVVWTTAPDGQTVEDSPTWRAFTGQTFDEWKGWGWLDAIHPDDRERTARVWRQAIDGKSVCQTECRLRTARGEYRWTAVRAVPVLNADQTIREWVGANTDITDQKSADEQLRASEERFRMLFESMTEGFCVVEMIYDGHNRPADYRFVQVNPTFETHTGLKNALGRTIRELVPDHDAHWFEIYGAVATTGEPVRFMNEAKAMGRWYDVYAYRVGGPDSPRVGILFTDITARKEDENDLRRMAADLSEADRRKDEFLAILAHELRNPLAPLRNGLEVMRLAGNDAATVEQVRSMMERQLAQMIRLIDDLLDLSRISRGKVQLRRERIELAKVVQQAVETSRPLIDVCGHELTVAVPPQPIFVEADSTRLTQVFSNLLNNAAKYTERGGQITLTVEQHGSDALISVRDTGIGIPSNMLSRLFEMFTQMDCSLERAQGGLGIGLSLVKRLVEMHGGSVEGRSDGQGAGSEFVVRLPVVLSLVCQQRVEHDGQDAAPQARRRILVVDDNRDAALSLAMMLRLMGNEAQTAHDGLEAITVAAAYRPDLILLDIGMPNLNGYDAARRIREQPWGKSMVLVALTGWGQDEDKLRSQAAGFDAHVTKPPSAEAIQKLLDLLHTETG